MSKLGIFMADGCEEIEGLTVVDLVRRAGIEIEMISVSGNDMVTGSHKIAFRTDVKKADADYASYDGIVLPGGMPGTTHLMEDETVNRVIREFAESGKLVAAICAAPSVFGDLGILKGKEAVCYPGFEERLTGATIGEGTVAVTEHVITSRGMGTAIDFAAALIARLQDEKKAEEIKASIIYRQ